MKASKRFCLGIVAFALVAFLFQAIASAEMTLQLRRQMSMLERIQRGIEKMKQRSAETLRKTQAMENKLNSAQAELGQRIREPEVKNTINTTIQSSQIGDMLKVSPAHGVGNRILQPTIGQNMQLMPKVRVKGFID